jgi:hypothetical protein
MAMNRALLARSALFFGWAITMGASIVAAVRAPEFLGATGPGVAILESIAGEVQIRDGGSPLWIDGVRGQQLSSGTNVATGRHSRALVRFESGYDIEVGESSQVVVERPRAQAGADSIVNLVKGTVDSRVAEPSRPVLTRHRLVIKAGTQRVMLREKEDRATVVRAPGAAVPTVNAGAGAPVQLDVRSGVTRTLAVVVPPPAPAASARAKDAEPLRPAPVAATPATEPVVATPAAEPANPVAPAAPADAAAPISIAAIEVATPPLMPPEAPSPLSSPPPILKLPPLPPLPQRLHVPLPLPRPLRLPSRLPPPPAPEPVLVPAPAPPPSRVYAPPRIITPTADLTYWTPRALPSRDPLRVPIVVTPLPKGSPGRPAVEIQRANGERQIVVANPRGEMRRLVAMLDIKGPESVVVKPTIATREAAKLEVAPARERRLRVRSLVNVSEGKAVTVSLRRLAAVPGDGLIAERFDFDPDEAGVTLRLAEGGDLPKLAPFLRGSDGFAIRTGRRPAPSSGLHVVRDGQIAATLTGEVEPAAARGLLESLGGSFAFSGKRDSYQQILPAARSQGDIVLLTRAGLRVDLHQTLLHGHAPARAIAAQHGEQFFIGKPVAIIPEPKSAAMRVPPRGLAEWMSPSGAPGYPRRFAFIESTSKGGVPVFLRLDVDTFNGNGLFESVDGTEALLAFQLNRKLQGNSAAATGAAAKSGGAVLSQILEYSGADAVVIAPPNGRWSIATVVAGKVVGLGSAEPPALRGDAAAVHSWLSGALGIEGLVLERRGDHALALCSMLKGKPERQGVVAASQAIVEVIEASAGRCLLRSLLGRPAAGDKILFE